jgi:hypothetical protein
MKAITLFALGILSMLLLDYIFIIFAEREYSVADCYDYQTLEYGRFYEWN